MKYEYKHQRFSNSENSSRKPEETSLQNDSATSETDKKPLHNNSIVYTDTVKNTDWKKHILIIDDSPVMLRALQGILHNNYHVATATSGRIALQYLRKKTVDLILLDYEMPLEDGPVVMKKLRSNPETSSIPIIFLTGVQDSTFVQRALSLKPEGYLLKPVNTATLMQRIQEILP